MYSKINFRALRILNAGFNFYKLCIFDNLPNLRCLYLNNNHRRYLWQIQKLQPGIFNNLPRLTSILDLDDNHRRCLWQIRELQPDTFNNLSNLEYLSLDSNLIQELQPGIFNNLDSLEDLSLNSNQIRKIHYGVFNNGLSKLIRLYLHP